MNHRLREHDYSGRGFYFITAATYPRRNLFSVISDCKTHLTPLGEIVRDEWLRLHGEQPLLDYPRLATVVVHRRRPPEETELTINHFVDLAASGAILIGGFISPGEKEVARRIAALPNARVIYLLPHGMAHYKPRGKAVDRIANSQTLALSGFGDGIPETPINYDNCHFNNDLAKEIAERETPLG